MRKIFLGIMLAILLLLTACDAGYQQENGRWVFITYNESAGRVVKPIDGADMTTFEEIKGEYARDAQHVFFRGQILSGADPATFERIAGLYWKDKNSVYYVDHPIPGADPRSFRRIGSGPWWRDDANVYVGEDPLNPKDLASFKPINADWAKDALWYYPQKYNNYIPITELDYASFTLLKAGWARDCCRAYYYDTIVEGADLATFEIVNEFRARDQNWYYLMGTRQRTVAEENALQERLKTPAK